MRKVCLVTCYVDNYGACLQAYALQDTIKSLGHEVEILSYTPSDRVKQKNAINKIKFGVREIYRLFRYKHYSFNFFSHYYFCKFRKKHLVFSETNYASEYDVINSKLEYRAYVVGSDQLWNPIIHNYQNNRVYFLDFEKNGAKKIAYAPSVGIDKFPSKDLENDAINLLVDFDFLSCREETGAKLITQLMGKQCCQVLDPTFLLSASHWTDISGKRIIDGDYAFIYRFGDSEIENEIIDEFVKNVNMPVYCLPMSISDFKLKKINLLNPCGPCEFVNYIKNSKFVLTDSFHATAFSINLNVNFGCMLRNTSRDDNNMNSRIFDILELFNLSKRLISSKEFIKDILATEINFDEANTFLNKRRNECTKLLETNLKEGK